MIYTLRSDLLLGQSSEWFTDWKCEWFQLSSYGLVALQQLLIYFVFIYRVQISFEGTVYQYPRRLYRALYLSLCVSFFVVVPVIVLSCYSGNGVEYVLYYFDHSGYVWCDILVDDHRYSLSGRVDPKRIFFVSGIVFSIVCLIFFDVVSLYLFTARLYSLQIELMQQHIAEMLPDVQLTAKPPPVTITVTAAIDTATADTADTATADTADEETAGTRPTLSASKSVPMISMSNGSTISDPDGPNELDVASERNDSAQRMAVPVPSTPRSHSVPMEEPDAPDARRRSVDRHSDPEIGGLFEHKRPGSKQLTLSIERVRKEAKARNEGARRIMNLHRLIKQHSILVWTQIAGYIAWATSVVLLSSWCWILVIWVLVLNNLCLWLMFGVSSKYWKCATKWLCCALCYRFNGRKNIAHRTRCCFC